MNLDDEEGCRYAVHGDSRVGCIEHEHCVEGSVVSSVQCRLSVLGVRVRAHQGQPSLFALPLPRLAFALLPSLVPFSTYCSISEHFVLRAQLVFLACK